MTNCRCGHSKKEHTRTVSKDGIAVSLGCINDNCETYRQICGEYFRPEPNPERLDGRCAKIKGHEGKHDALLMYQM